MDRYFATPSASFSAIAESISGDNKAPRDSSTVGCANIDHDSDGRPHICGEPAEQACGRCYLVKYCSLRCQLKHAPLHKLDCEYELLREDWKPSWDREGRAPWFFIRQKPIVNSNILRKSLWGDMPAYDLLKLDHNEGLAYRDDLNLCFAASGDLRNVLLTVNSIEPLYPGICTMVINDRDHAVTARNAILLLMAIELDSTASSEAMLHLWYSTRIPVELVTLLATKIAPPVAEFVEKIQHRSETDLHTRRWSSGRSSICLRLLKRQWRYLLKILTSNLSLATTETKRLIVTHDMYAFDQQQRHYFNMDPSVRICAQKLTATGILLPYGSSLRGFEAPNPTLFDSETGEWLQDHTASPLKGHDLRSIMLSKAGNAPPNDINGKLYLYLLDLIRTFRAQIHHISLHFVVLGADCLKNPELLAHPPISSAGFDRIDTDNLADRAGLERVLKALDPLLKHPTENTKAVLITLLKKAVRQAEQSLGLSNNTTIASQKAQASQYLPLITSTSPNDPGQIRLDFASGMFKDKEKLFKHWIERIDEEGIAARTGMVRSRMNSVTDRWLYKTPRNREDFDLMLAVDSLGHERFVEWRRLKPGEQRGGKVVFEPGES